MDIKTCQLLSDDYPGLILRAIDENDLENLRIWKNFDKRNFFFKELISSAQQSDWYLQYKARPQDVVFVIETNSVSIGCLGARLLDTTFDIYNVILGNKGFSKAGFMSKAMKMLCSHLLTYFEFPITAKVISTNPALEWYNKNGFEVISLEPEHVVVRLDAEKFLPCHVAVCF